ncbi:TPA: hypothetical protein HA251_02235 [Candidatus Woesearchaeota archaeon]|nr:hypothetical protein [Candidatus Woesearchaeota archaeon]
MTVLLIPCSSSDPLIPFNVIGYIFDNGGTSAANGIPIIINDTTSGTFALTQVYAPPIPQLAGAYSATINGTAGDTIIVYAWNSTNYGMSSKILSDTTRVNVTLNLTRVPEPNVTITTPVNDTTVGIGVPFNVSVNVTALINGGNCSISIQFGNTSVFNLSTGENITHDLGEFTTNETKTTLFSVMPVRVGSSSITANASCTPFGPSFSARTVHTAYNVTVVDNETPMVTLVMPADDALNRTNHTIFFLYTVDDWSSIANCTLYIDDNASANDSTVTKLQNQTLSATLSNGDHEWLVSCADIYGNIGNSSAWNISIGVYPPVAETVQVEQGITLNAGTTREVTCNATFSSVYGASYILSANATIFAPPNRTFDPDNPNTHYSNNSCATTFSAGNETGFSCSFRVWSFAVNGTWRCNMTAVDNDTLQGAGVNNTTINPLYALNITVTSMVFGSMQANSYSGNVTQVLMNLGNRPINISVFAYGGTMGDGNAFSCGSSNITANNMRFSTVSTANFTQKTPLLLTPRQMGFTIPKQTVVGPAPQNTTWWQLFAPLNISDVGSCFGNIVFQAEPV